MQIKLKEQCWNFHFQSLITIDIFFFFHNVYQTLSYFVQIIILHFLFQLIPEL